MNNVAMNIKVQIFLWDNDLLILDVHPKVRLLDNRAILFLISSGTMILFAKSGFINVNFQIRSQMVTKTALDLNTGRRKDIALTVHSLSRLPVCYTKW